MEFKKLMIYQKKIYDIVQCDELTEVCRNMIGFT